MTKAIPLSDILLPMLEAMSDEDLEELYEELGK